MNRMLAIGAVAAAVLAGAAWYLAPGGGRAGDPGATPVVLAGEAQAQTAPATEIDLSRVVEMVVGSPEAPVTIIEYSSFTCPHCANFNRGVYRQIYERYVETGVVRIVKREVYFDRYGLWAALVARCGGPERYFGIVEMLYENQRDWAGAQPTAGQSQDEAVVEQLRRIGRRAGMNDAELNACLSDRDLALALMETYRRNAAADQITATPSFVINGRRYSNMSFADFEAAIAQARGS
jgi:protein-disulfide isomerase